MDKVLKTIGTGLADYDSSLVATDLSIFAKEVDTKSSDWTNVLHAAIEVDFFPAVKLLIGEVIGPDPEGSVFLQR